MTEPTMTTFETGATRSNDADKIDPEGFLSPLVIRRYSEYLHKHRIQADGKARPSDNWQKGMPLQSYMKSAWRHFLNWWTLHRGWPSKETDIEDAICAVIFNASGYLHERLRAKEYIKPSQVPLVDLTKAVTGSPLRGLSAAQLADIEEDLAAKGY